MKRCTDSLIYVTLYVFDTGEPYHCCVCRCLCPTPPLSRCTPAETERQRSPEVSAVHTNLQPHVSQCAKMLCSHSNLGMSHL